METAMEPLAPKFGEFAMPPEIFIKILLNLRAEDFGAASMVCKSWRRVMDDSSSLKWNFKMKKFIKWNGYRMEDAFARKIDSNSGDVFLIDTLIHRFVHHVVDAHDNLSNSNCVRKLSRSSLELARDSPELFFDETYHRLRETNSVFKDVDFRNKVLCFGPYQYCNALVLSLKDMSGLGRVGPTAGRIVRCAIWKDWVLFGLEPEVRHGEVSGASGVSIRVGSGGVAGSGAVGCGIGHWESRAMELWRWSGEAPRRLLHLPYADLKFTNVHPDYFVAVTEDRAELCVWRFCGDDTEAEPLRRHQAPPYNIRTFAWEDYAIDAERLLAAKKWFIGPHVVENLSIHIFSLISGEELRTIENVPCRSLKIHGNRLRTVRFSGSIIEIDFALHRRRPVLVFESRRRSEDSADSASNSSEIDFNSADVAFNSTNPNSNVSEAASNLSAVASTSNAATNFTGAASNFPGSNSTRISSSFVPGLKQKLLRLLRCGFVLREATPYVCTNEHKDGPWLLARRDRFYRILMEEDFDLPEFIYLREADGSPEGLKGMSREHGAVVGAFCVVKFFKGVSNDWTVEFKDFFAGDEL